MLTPRGFDKEPTLISDFMFKDVKKLVKNQLFYFFYDTKKFLIGFCLSFLYIVHERFKKIKSKFFYNSKEIICLTTLSIKDILTIYDLINSKNVFKNLFKFVFNDKFKIF